MSMDFMPDDCLLNIFNSIEDAKTLFRCLRVCRRWYCLVSYRLAKVENLLDLVYYPIKPGVKSLCFEAIERPLEVPILAGIFKKSPKIKVVSVGFEYTRYTDYDINWAQKSLDWLSKLESVKGIISQPSKIEDVTIPQSIEALCFVETFLTPGEDYPRVRQLMIDDTFFLKGIDRFPNLERLNLVIDCDHCSWFKLAIKKHHIFKKLKILEIDTSYEGCLSMVNYACQFVHLCPQLESAHMRIPIDQGVPYTNYMHPKLKNLVLTYVDYEQVEEYYLNLLGLLKRYPNIKHLAIKYDTYYIDSNRSSPGENEREEPVDEVLSRSDDGIRTGSVIPFLIVSMLPKLVLLDMRDITGVDETSAKYVQEYCQSRKRSIKFYFGFIGDNEIKRDWPELFTDSSEDSREFNFMKQLFLPDYSRPPYFLDPI